MTHASSSPCRDLLSIEKLIAEEVRLESERRGAAVSPHHAAVQGKVCRTLLGNGASGPARDGEWVFTELTAAEEDGADASLMAHHEAA